MGATRTGGLVRCRWCDLRDEIAARFGVALAERTMGDLLHELNFSRVSVQLYHPQKDAAAQEAFKN